MYLALRSDKLHIVFFQVIIMQGIICSRNVELQWLLGMSSFGFGSLFLAMRNQLIVKSVQSQPSLQSEGGDIFFAMRSLTSRWIWDGASDWASYLHSSATDII